MGILFKLIVILGLVFLILSLFTKTKAERAARRNRATNLLLLAIVVLLAVSIGLNLYTRFGS